MLSMRPDPEIRVQKITIPAGRHRIPALVLSPKEAPVLATGVLWIHGGGYILGMKEMVHMSRAVDLVKEFGAVVVSPGYRLAFAAPYPAALDDCYAALVYMKVHAAELGIRADQIMVGGESAGGGLCAALCIKARDTGAVNVAFQMPLYPMLDDRDTETSRDNHGKVWNTRRNHFGWRCYLRGQKRNDLSPYAAPARLTDFSGLPPAYTFVGDGEPFYAETVQYIENLKKCGIPASVDVYHSDMHAFDMMQPDTPLSREAARRFNEQFAYAQACYFAPQGEAKGEEELKNRNLVKEYSCMKKMILGTVWQLMGFIGAIIIVCSAAPHKWDYNGITGILGSLLGLDLLLPLIICIVLFICGALVCFKSIKEK